MIPRFTIAGTAAFLDLGDGIAAALMADRSLQLRSDDETIQLPLCATAPLARFLANIEGADIRQAVEGAEHVEAACDEGHEDGKEVGEQEERARILEALEAHLAEAVKATLERVLTGTLGAELVERIVTALEADADGDTPAGALHPTALAALVAP